MPVVISLLRAVNVGRRQIKMDGLRSLYASLGLQEPQSYVQSGNVVFRTRETNLARLAARIEDAIEAMAGFRSEAILRTTSEMRAVVAANPFADRPDVEPNKLLVNFLAAVPDAGAAETIAAIKTDGEELHLLGRELYIYFPNGVGRSKLPMPRIAKALQTHSTARNWNSVLKLLEMAEKLER